ncbi:MAG TPA: ASKHA domain-containing protein [bacterium]|nr:ASKHA domain-containing protein [bacterium]
MSDDARAAITLTFLPSGKRTEVPCGTTLIDAALRLGLEIESLCGGAGLCGRCRVQLIAGSLPVTPADRENLTAAELAQGFRLACAAQPDADCTIEIPVPAAQGEIVSAGAGREVPLDPAMRRVPLRLHPPTLEQGPSDLEVLMTALPAGTGMPPLSLLQRLPRLLRDGGWRGDAILLEGRLIDFQIARQPLCGLAIDLGTTTVVAKLIDLESGQVLSTAAGLNRQRRYGEDVIARVGHANAHGPAELQGLIVSQLNQMVDELTAEAGITRDSIFTAVVAGNTVMEHLLLGLPPRHLAEMPYVPVIREFPPVAAREIGLRLHPEAQLTLMPVLGKFVGGDTAAVLLTLAGRLDETWLAVDIGTNGEILLCHRGRIWTTSAAAGPAFEGAHIGVGMRAAAGAIERVWWRGDHLEVRVIGGGKASGLCGSGLIDAIAALLEAGALDASGRLAAGHPLVELLPAAGTLPDQLAARLAPGVLLTQRDIRELQLANAAIAAAIELLLQAAGLRAADLEHLFLAGAFGQYLSPQAALRIGLLPPVAPEIIKFIGNAACRGAEMGVVNSGERRQIAALAGEVEYVEVAAGADFQECFAEKIRFGRG